MTCYDVYVFVWYVIDFQIWLPAGCNGIEPVAVLLCICGRMHMSIRYFHTCIVMFLWPVNVKVIILNLWPFVLQRWAIIVIFALCSYSEKTLKKSISPCFQEHFLHSHRLTPTVSVSLRFFWSRLEVWRGILGLSAKKRAAVGGILVYSVCKRRAHFTHFQALFYFFISNLNPNFFIKTPIRDFRVLWR